MSKEDQTGSGPTEKIEKLISQGKKAQTNTATTQETERKKKVENRAVSEEAEAGGEGPGVRKKLKEEILVTLTETSRELSRIIGALLDEGSAPLAETQVLPRFCWYCGRNLLPNALYCDLCGASVKGA